MAIFKYLKMAEVDSLRERNIIVLSPHPDDDIIGCGGTIYRYYLKGARVVSVYMTDGRKGNPGYNEDDLVGIRKEEAKRASAIVGIERVIFLNNRDTELSPTSAAIIELSKIIKDIRPEAIFLPFLLDTHPDHMATNKILVGAMKSLPTFMCYAYGIWAPLPTFNLSVDITPYMDIKKRALKEHRSQMEMLDFIEASFGLSKYYSVMFGKENAKGWAEVYIVCPSDEYKRLAEAMSW